MQPGPIQPVPLLTNFDPMGTLHQAVQFMLNIGMPALQYAGEVIVMNVITVTLLVWMWKLMFGGWHTTAWDALVLILKCTAAYTIVANFRTVIPGLDYSFVGLFDSQFNEWMLMFGKGTVNETYMRLELLMAKFVAPTGGIFALVPVLLYFLALLLLAITKVLVIVSVAFGLIGQALTRLWGPIFLSFILVPELRRYAWNWIHTYVYFSMLPVMAFAYLFIMNVYIGRALTILPPGRITTIGYFEYMMYVIGVYGVFIFGIPLIPMVTGMLTTGGPGHGPGWNPMR